MTVSSEQSRVQYATDGVATSFPVPFRFLQNPDLRVTLVQGDGSERHLSLDVDYSVTGAGQQAGGTLTTTDTYTPGQTLLIDRIVSITQETSYQRNDPFPERAHERALDKLTMICQQMASIFGMTSIGGRRVLMVRDSDGGIGYLPLRRHRANHALGFNANGDPVAIPSDLPQLVDALERAEAAAESAQKNADSSEEDAATASDAAKRAEIAAEVAQQYSRMYRNIAEGLASTNDGEYFYVPVPGSSDLLILYQHVGAYAIEIGRYPSSTLITALGLRITELEKLAQGVERLGINGWLLAHLDQVNALLMGLRESGVLVVPAGVEAPGVAQVIPTTGDVLEAHVDQDRRALSEWTYQGQRRQVMSDGTYRTVYDIAWITELQEQLAQLTGGGSGGSSNLQRMLRRCFNGFQDVNVCAIGDSEVWGVGASNTGPTTPRDFRLSDPRANLTCRSWVNVFREYLGRMALNIAVDAMPTPETAPGAVSGGSGYYSQQQVTGFAHSEYVHLYSPDGMELAQETVRTDPPAVVADALILPAGCHVEVEVLAPGFDLYFATSVASVEATFSVFADGALLATQSFYAASPSWGNQLTVTMPAYRLSVLRIQNNASIGLSLEGLVRDKVIRVVNQGISGTTSESWLPVPPTDRLLLTAAIPQHTSDILLALGTNDRVGARVVPPNITWHQRNMSEIIGWLKANRPRAVVTLICGYATLDEDGGTKLYGQRDLARAQVELAQRYGVGVLNLYPQMRAAINNGEPLFNPSDLLHMADYGHTFIALDAIAKHCELNIAR